MIRTHHTTFECFMVVRPTWEHVEVHIVGASGTALDEILDLVDTACSNAVEELLAAGEVDPDDVEMISLTANMLDARAPFTGIRVTNVSQLKSNAHDVALFVRHLGDVFDPSCIYAVTA